MSLAIIGGGNMGTAIAQALIQAHILRSDELLMVEMDADKRSYLSQQLGCEVAAGIDGGLSNYKTIILAVKPQGAVPVMNELSPHLQPQQLILSIMAGVSVTTLTKNLKLSRSGHIYESAKQLECCYDYDYPFDERLRRLGQIIANLNKLHSVDHELLVLAASIRWLTRSRHHYLVKLMLSEYQGRCLKITDGQNRDCLGVVTDIIDKNQNNS